MIKLVFSIQREVFRIEIKGKEIWYLDRRWEKAVRLIPADENIKRKIIMSRNKIPSFLTDLFTLTEKEKQEYEGAKSEKELAAICVKDAQTKGCKLLKKENGHP